jgi:hypothetical protein
MRQKLSILLVAALAATGTLTACGGGGGGGGGADDSASVPPSAQAIASFNAVSDDCGAGVTLPDSKVEGGLHELRDRTVQVGGVAFPVAIDYSADGFEPPDDPGIKVQMGLEDLRGLTTGNYVHPGYASQDVQMGVALSARVPAAGITCVKGVAGMRSNRDGTKTIVWTSRGAGGLDVAGLPAPAVDGFEWISSYPIGAGGVFFGIGKALADPATARVCQRAPGATAWNCSVPTVTATAQGYQFVVAPATPGVYVLAAERPAAAP